MDIIIKCKIEPRNNQSNLVKKKKVKHFSLIPKLKVIDGKLVGQWHKS